MAEDLEGNVRDIRVMRPTLSDFALWMIPGWGDIKFARDLKKADSIERGREVTLLLNNKDRLSLLYRNIAVKYVCGAAVATLIAETFYR